MVEVEEVLAYKPLSRTNIETASILKIAAKNLALNFNFNSFDFQTNLYLISYLLWSKMFQKYIWKK